MLLATTVIIAAAASGAAPAAAAGNTTISGVAAAAGAIDATKPPAGNPFYGVLFDRLPAAADLMRLGRALFNDASLSASGKTACASCHSPAHAFGPPDGASVRRAGRDGARPGVRAVPSLRYLQTVSPFAEHTFDDEGDDSIDQGPAGGLTWDGRASSTHAQAALPLLSPFEMANAGGDAVVAALEHGAYAARFRAVFGARVFVDRALGFKAVLMALEAYQQSPEEFYPYSSKYDAWLEGQASLSAAEARGLAAFNDPARGNCARCHPSAMHAGASPQFTDFGYAAIGAPRNAAIPANADRRYYDLGLCGPLRQDLAGRKEYCGLFRTPSLRNVAARPVFFHNGVLHRLDDVVRFYAERDTAPQKWYPVAQGATQVFDDLPTAYRRNLDRGAPFGGPVGGRPAMSEGDVCDIVAFLKTLTDGYMPATPPAASRNRPSPPENPSASAVRP